MPLRSTTATALSRNLSDLLNQVRYQGVTLEVKRGNEVIALVSPPANVAGYPIDDLDRLLAATQALSDEEAQDFLRDVREANERLTAETSAWGS